MSYVCPELFLFHLSVKDNFKIGMPEASDECVIRAAKIAQTDVFIAALSHGYGAPCRHGSAFYDLVDQEIGAPES